MDLFSALLTLLAALVGKCYGVDWSYDRKDDWPRLFAPACNGTYQSPIDIDTSKVVVDEASLNPFVFKLYDKALENDELVNNGHTVQVNLKNTNVKPSISGGGLGSSYIFAQMHFHWGSKSSKGSEHTINKKKYPAEVHLVHYRQDLKTLANAADKPNGLAVLGALFELSTNDNGELEAVVQNLKKIIYSGSEINVSDTIYLNKFLPKKTALYYRYNGSLTTPSCFESVIWTVFDDKIKISERQLKFFRNVYGPDNDTHLEDNFRNVMSLNNREIRASSSGHLQNSEVKNMVFMLICIALTKLGC